MVIRALEADLISKEKRQELEKAGIVYTTYLEGRVHCRTGFDVYSKITFSAELNVGMDGLELLLLNKIAARHNGVYLTLRNRGRGEDEVVEGYAYAIDVESEEDIEKAYQSLKETKEDLKQAFDRLVNFALNEDG